MLTAVPSMDTAKLEQTLQSKVDSNVVPNEIQKPLVPIRVVEGSRGCSVWQNHNHAKPWNHSLFMTVLS